MHAAFDTLSRRRRVRGFTAGIVAAAGALLCLSVAVPGAHGVVGGSGIMERLGCIEIRGAVSIAFSSTRPVASVNTRGNAQSVVVALDISEPEQPSRLGELVLPGRSPDGSPAGLEDMNLGERADGTQFLLVGSGAASGEVVDGLVVIDVTDPEHLKRVSGLDVGSHTWNCLGRECNYAYSTAGQISDGEPREAFNIVNLTDLHRPVVEAT